MRVGIFLCLYTFCAKSMMDNGVTSLQDLNRPSARARMDHAVKIAEREQNIYKKLSAILGYSTAYIVLEETPERLALNLGDKKQKKNRKVFRKAKTLIRKNLSGLLALALEYKVIQIPILIDYSVNDFNNRSIVHEIIRWYEEKEEKECFSYDFFEHTEFILTFFLTQYRSRIDLEEKNERGLTALHSVARWMNIPFKMCNLARTKRFSALGKLLLEHGADPNARSSSGMTILHKVMGCGRNEFIELLLKKGADVHAYCLNADTPLHRAVCCNRRYAVTLLLNNKANINACNKQFATPFDLAYSMGNITLATYLIKSGARINLSSADSYFLERLAAGDGQIN